MAHFEHSSVIAAPRSKVFNFIADIKNLNTIMQPEYKTELVSPANKMAQGEEYELRVSRFGISVLWGVLIEEFKPEEMFRDRQTHGPFALWLHTHKFEDHGQGTLLHDVIEYDVPFGLLGKLLDDVVIRRELSQLFQSRHQKIQSMVSLIS
jgi:ligand-binding SRPBCC domain-containing protein